MRDLAPAWYWGSLAAIALARLTWWAMFVDASTTGRRGQDALHALRANLAMSTKHRVEAQTQKSLTDAELGIPHRAFLEATRGQRSDALTLGALGLAAWGVLESRTLLDPFSLDILFVGVLLTIAGPLVFRAAGTEGTRMGLETALAVGYAAIVIALASFLARVFDSEWLDIAGFVIAAGLVVRDFREVGDEIRRSLGLIGSPPAQAAGSLREPDGTGDCAGTDADSSPPATEP